MTFLKPSITDFLDIAIVFYIIYRILLVIRGTRATQMLLGLLLLLICSILAQWFHLNALSLMISTLEAVWVLGFIIVFQPELRRGLAELGRSRFFRFFMKTQEHKVLEEVIKAVEKLIAQKSGALIVLERQTGLKSYVETGTKLEAAVSAELISTIFTQKSPLHDGAVIIGQYIVKAAGCILPLTEQPVYDKELGTRHRAAIGLSEQTDAIVIVVSEETQQVSLTYDGFLERNISIETLRKRLKEITAEIITYGEE
ncbi:MAG: diadenylate cyclase CdaA [Candidatus Glassbacteria bacterium]